MPQLAREAGLSERTFARRFREVLGTTPMQWILQERVRLAQELLEMIDYAVESVAQRTGFGGATNLRYHFGRLTGVPADAPPRLPPPRDTIGGVDRGCPAPAALAAAE